jgi:hypothetical protein
MRITKELFLDFGAPIELWRVVLGACLFFGGIWWLAHLLRAHGFGGVLLTGIAGWGA